MKRVLCVIALCVCGYQLALADLRDPTRPATMQGDAVHAENYELSAILISTERKIAVINGIWVHEGQQFEGATILSISANAVEIQGPEGHQTLNLLTNAFKPVKEKDAR